jgi:tRNA threonylcarbamoyladenosine biosynthesis protein TsaB
MALLLAIETSTNNCSVALFRDSSLLGHFEVRQEKTHADFLVEMITSLCTYCRIDINALQAVAISMGPGSYTGLRIGTSVAKGICFSTGASLIGVNTLEAMLQALPNALDEGVVYIPMIDARRLEVYCLYANHKKEIIKDSHAKILDEDSLKNEPEGARKVLFGDGAEKLKSLFDGRGDIQFMDAIFPSAVQIGKVANQKFKEHQFENLAYFEPFYLKEFKSTVAKKVF